MNFRILEHLNIRCEKEIYDIFEKAETMDDFLKNSYIHDLRWNMIEELQNIRRSCKKAKKINQNRHYKKNNIFSLKPIYYLYDFRNGFYRPSDRYKIKDFDYDCLNFETILDITEYTYDKEYSFKIQFKGDNCYSSQSEEDVFTMLNYYYDIVLGRCDLLYNKLLPLHEDLLQISHGAYYFRTGKKFI